MSLGPTELIIILVIVIVLFGVGRISKIAGELGTGIRSFKEGLEGDKEEGKEIVFSDVLLVEKSRKVKIGTPLVKGAKVTGKVLKQGKAIL